MIYIHDLTIITAITIDNDIFIDWKDQLIFIRCLGVPFYSILFRILIINNNISKSLIFYITWLFPFLAQRRSAIILLRVLLLRIRTALTIRIITILDLYHRRKAIVIWCLRIVGWAFQIIVCFFNVDLQIIFILLIWTLHIWRFSHKFTENVLLVIKSIFPTVTRVSPIHFPINLNILRPGIIDHYIFAMHIIRSFIVFQIVAVVDQLVNPFYT